MLEFITCQSHISDDIAAMVETIHLTESSAETSQVQHSAILPKERMYGRNPGGVIGNRISIRKSDNLAAYVHILAKAVGATQCAKVAHHSFVPEERPGLCTEAGQRKRIRDRVGCYPGYLAPIINREGGALISAECSQGNDFIMLPKGGNPLRHAEERIDETVL